jgi:hypothetical protein
MLDVSDATPVVDYFEDSVPGFARTPAGTAPPAAARTGARKSASRRRKSSASAARRRR